MMQKKKFSVAALLDIKKTVPVSEDMEIDVRPLSLEEMITLFLGYQSTFLQLYAVAMEDKKEDGLAEYSSFMLATPELVARIVATASDQGTDDETITTIRKHMPATSQVTALVEIMKLSVPDAKKAKELLSEVMAQLRNALQRKAAKAQTSDGQTT